MWLMGNGVNGGKWHGQWDGLAKVKLNEGRDLPVHHDFRAVFAQTLVNALGLTLSQTEHIFQGARWDASLNSLFKA
jgi:uncharacterized protein (DUF1501 family)